MILKITSRKQKLQNIKWESHLQLLRHKMGKLQWWWVFVVVLLVTLINTKGKSDSCKREVFRSRSSAVLLINWLENVNIFALALVKMGHVLFHSVSHTVSSINFNEWIKLMLMFQRLKFTINHGRSSTLPHYWRYNPMEHSSQWWTSREKV